MLVQRWRDLEEYDPGSILGKPDLGIKVKRLSSREIASNFRVPDFELEYYTVEPGKSFPLHKSQYGMINFVISGVASFVSDKTQIEARKGDMVYTEHGELQSISNYSDERLEIICYMNLPKTRLKNIYGKPVGPH